MKRLLLLLLLCAAEAGATVVSGRIADLTGQTLTSNRSVTFTLQNCGDNIPRILGNAVIAPATKTLTPNAAGLLAGTIAGNDVIECGTTIGQTYYKVDIYAGTQKIYEKTYRIAGATWNLSTAIPLSNDPTAFLTYNGYLLGDLIYGSGNNALSLLRGNSAIKRKFLAEQGDGVNPAPPFWADLDDLEISVLPPISGDVVNTPQNSTQLTVNSIGNRTAAQVASAVDAVGEASSSGGTGNLVKRDGSGNFTLPSHSHTASAVTDFSTAADARITAQKGIALGLATLDSGGKLTGSQLPNLTSTNLSDFQTAVDARITAQKGVNDGLATLGAGGKVPTAQIPSLTASFISDFSTAADARITAQKGVISGIATLDASGTVPTGQIPALNYQAPLGFTPENAANKGVNGGYVPLGSDGKISVAYLPAASGLTAVQQDPAPTLGGALNLNGNSVTGNLVFTADNTYDIGASGANRPRKVYAGGDGWFGGSLSSGTFLDVGTVLNHRGNILVLNKAGNGWVTWGTRSTSGTEALMDLSNLGAISATGAITTTGFSTANAVQTTGSYSDPSWLTITKTKVGLSAVENTALSTWAGSANITAIGTLVSGAVPWSLLSSVPSSVTNITSDLAAKAPIDNPRFTGTAGMGVSSPAAILHIATSVSGGPYAGAGLIVEGSGNATVPRFIGRRYLGTPGSPTVAVSLTNLAQFVGQGLGPSGYAAQTNQPAGMIVRAMETFTDSSQGAQIEFWTVPSGAITALERMRIESNGNIGIGGSFTPTRLLHLQSASTGSSPGVTIESIDTGGKAYSILSTATGSVVGVGKFAIFESGAARLVIDGSGNVGLGGTADPKSKLHVTGLDTHASNAAAITAGKTAGAFYTDGAGNVKVVY